LRTFWTWVLLAAWTFLVTFGLVTLISPPWLVALSQRGEKSEGQAYRHYGDTALKQGNYRLAIAQYLYALKIRADQPDVCVNLAMAYLKSGNTRLGEATLLQAAGMNPSPGLQAMISIRLGELSEIEHRDDEAIQHYEVARDQEASPELVYEKLGTLYLRKEDYHRALDVFEKLLAEQIDSLLPYRNMLRRTRELAQDDPELQGWLDSEGRGERAGADWGRFDLPSIRKMQATSPEVAKTHNHLGLICFRLGDRQGAIRHFEQSQSIWPGNVDAVRNLQIIRSERARSGSGG
jgi:tetratricopeptide (TPR) repeat protein